MGFLRKGLYKNDCCIVAAYNCMLWTYSPMTYESIKNIAESKFEYTEQNGIPTEHFSKFLESLRMPTSIIENKPFNTIEDALKKGFPVVLAYYADQETIGHVIFLIKDKSGQIKLLNSDGTRETVQEISTDISSGKINNFWAWTLPLKGKK